MIKDNDYMQQCLVLAKQGQMTCAPNPMVGCIIVKNDNIISTGFHKKAGEPHAEINAIKLAGEKAKGATLYVNLEPCDHHGKTPPCTEAIIKAGIRRVVIAMQDPNPLVSGKGIARLKDHGIETTLNVMLEEATSLNRIFSHYIKHDLPYVISKWAMSLDGKTITHPSDDRGISHDAVNKEMHLLRQQVDAILVGRKTAIHDDPLLTARPNGRESLKQPLRLILTTNGNLPKDLKLFNPRLPGQTAVVTFQQPDKEMCAFYQSNNIEMLQISDLHHLLTLLADRGISSLLIEGGEKTRNAFFDAKIINEVKAIISPVIIGSLEKKLKLQTTNHQQYKQDFVLTSIIGVH